MKRKNNSSKGKNLITEKKDCYLCSNKTVEKLFTKATYPIYQCKQCSLQFTDIKKPYSQFVKEFYQKSYFEGDKTRNAYADYEGDKKVIVKNFNHKLKKITRFIGNGNLLDIGCATGLFLQLAKESGFSVWGIEPSDYAFRLAKKRLGNSVKLGTAQDIDFSEESMDVITLFDVFEHLIDPIADLVKFRKWLKPGGYLVIITGDSRSFLAKVLGKYWHFYNPPQHLFFYSKKTISEILKREGFSVEKIEMEGKWFSLRYLLHLARTIYGSRISDFLYTKLKDSRMGKTPVYLNLKDTMTIYAMKN